VSASDRFMLFGLLVVFLLIAIGLALAFLGV
jgi:hypothetical protein